MFNTKSEIPDDVVKWERWIYTNLRIEEGNGSCAAHFNAASVKAAAKSLAALNRSDAPAPADTDDVESLAYRVANAKLGEGPSVRCEGPTGFEIDTARAWVRRVLAALNRSDAPAPADGTCPECRYPVADVGHNPRCSSYRTLAPAGQDDGEELVAALRELRSFLWPEGKPPGSNARTRHVAALDAVIASHARMKAEIEGVRNWLWTIVDSDLNEIVADGGITAGMVIQQETHEQIRRLTNTVLKGI